MAELGYWITPPKNRSPPIWDVMWLGFTVLTQAEQGHSATVRGLEHRGHCSILNCFSTFAFHYRWSFSPDEVQ